MKQITNNLFIASVSELPLFLKDSDNLKLVNVSSRYHKEYHHWEGKAPTTHPCYVEHHDPELFSLNWVDAKAEYFDYQGKGIERIHRMLYFIHHALKNKHKVVICCDQARSRAPSVGLLYLSCEGLITNKNFTDAAKQFVAIYPEYQPSPGICEFLENKWSQIVPGESVIL